jgi:hypothetical protein
MNRLISVDGLDVLCVSRGTVTEYFISAQANNSSDPGLLLTKLVYFLKERQAQLINFRIFTSPEFRKTLVDSAGNTLKQLDCPVTWLTQNADTFALTFHGHAVSGVPVKAVEFDGQVVGKMFEDVGTKYTHLCLVPETTNADNDAQTRDLFDRMDVIRSR